MTRVAAQARESEDRSAAAKAEHQAEVQRLQAALTEATAHADEARREVEEARSEGREARKAEAALTEQVGSPPS